MNSKLTTAMGLTLVSALTMGAALAAPLSEAFQDQRGERPFQSQERSQQFQEEVTHEMIKLDNGIQIKLTSDNAEIVEKLQNRDHGPKNLRENNEVEITKENLRNGIQITVTSTNEEIIQKLQEGRPEKRGERGGEERGERSGSGENQELREQIKHESNIISNGVEISITSDNPEAVELIQSRKAKEPRNEEISRIREEISNGVKITISSENPDLVEMIQEHAENPPQRRMRKRRGENGMNQRGGTSSSFGSQ